jgi:polyphosphate kinase 2 (PPK2 family)
MKNLFKLSEVTFPKPLEKSKYKELMEKYQERARLISHYAHGKNHGCVLVFEGWDAAGKGGAIRRLTSFLDPRLYSVISIAAPSTEEKRHNYLWRFWTKLNRLGHITIFDRSWYGRVLVERVEGFAKESEWKRAYKEIVNFEEDLTHAGNTVIKFWLQISPEEQLERFRARNDDPMRRWKLTEEDWRNRDKWHLYEEACDEMIQKTDVLHAPWIVIPANDKYTARVNVLKNFCDILEQKLDIPKKIKL